MRLIEETDGFSIVEALLVIGFIVILVAMGGTLGAKFATRRSVDRITGDISSTLQITKLKAARQGVEYRTLFASCADDLVASDPDLKCFKCPDSDYVDYSPGDKTLTIMRERGNSNNGTPDDGWCVETTTRDKMPSVITLDLSTMDPNPRRYVFNPNGTLGGNSGTLKVKPTGLSAENRGKRCGKIVVSPFGRIRVIQGNWIEVPAPGDCKPIK